MPTQAPEHSECCGVLHVTPDGMTHGLFAQRAEEVEEHVHNEAAEGDLHQLKAIEQHIGEEAPPEVEQALGA